MEKVYAAFELGDESYAVPVDNVKIIITMQSITHIPKTPDFIRGVINLRGKIIPVMDMKNMFNLEGGEGEKIIVMDINNNEFGLIVDEVTDVLRINDDDIEEVPEMISTSIDTKFMKGIIQHEDRLITIVDVERMFTGEEMKTLEKISKK